MPGSRPARINERGHIQRLNESCNMGHAKKQIGGRSASSGCNLICKTKISGTLKPRFWDTPQPSYGQGLQWNRPARQSVTDAAPIVVAKYDISGRKGNKVTQTICTEDYSVQDRWAGCSELCVPLPINVYSSHWIANTLCSSWNSWRRHGSATSCVSFDWSW